MNQEDRILDRVRKLLAVANCEGATEGERDNALRMAHNLLAKHELEMEDVKGYERDRLDPRELHENEGWNIAWTRALRRVMATLFLCRYVEGGRINATRGKHFWIGRVSAVTTAMWMSDWIIAALLKEADRRYKHRLTPEGRSFCVGVVDRLRQRVRAMQAEQQATFAEAGSALVVIDIAKSEEDANDDFMNANMRTHEIKVRQSSVRGNSYRDGLAHGDSIGLNTQVGNKKGTLAIK